MKKKSPGGPKKHFKTPVDWGLPGTRVHPGNLLHAGWHRKGEDHHFRSPIGGGRGLSLAQ